MKTIYPQNEKTNPVLSPAFYDNIWMTKQGFKREKPLVGRFNPVENKTMKTLCDADSSAFLIVHNDTCSFYDYSLTLHVHDDT